MTAKTTTTTKDSSNNNTDTEVGERGAAILDGIHKSLTEVAAQASASSAKAEAIHEALTRRVDNLDAKVEATKQATRSGLDEHDKRIDELEKKLEYFEAVRLAKAEKTPLHKQRWFQITAAVGGVAAVGGGVATVVVRKRRRAAAAMEAFSE